MYGEGSEAGAYFDEDVIDAWRRRRGFAVHISNVASLVPRRDTGAPLRSTPNRKCRSVRPAIYRALRNYLDFGLN